MFTKRFALFRLLGFEVSLDPSWLILAVLITWSLAAALFPGLYPDLGRATYWAMGVAGLLGLVLSIVLHELAHSVVARRYGMPIRGITLFIFGGVAEMEDEPVGPKAEFRMAIAGPIASLVIAAVFYALAVIAAGLGLGVAVSGLLSYLGTINLVLAVFNMVPAFPLDGGRVLRALLWGWKGSYVRATRIASGFGTGFGVLLIVLAVLHVVTGNLVPAMWWFLLGLFVRAAAQGSYQQAVIRSTLKDVPVSRLMTREPVTVAPGLTVDELVEDFFYRHSHKAFPVMDGDSLAGCVNLRDVKQVPRERWAESTVADILEPCSEQNTVTPDTDAAATLTRMMQSGNSRLLVSEGGRLLGIVSQSDIMRFLAVRLDLEGEDGAPLPRRPADRPELMAERR